MDDKYDCIDHEWQEECRDCGQTFTNQGLYGIDCPHCKQETEREKMSNYKAPNTLPNGEKLWCFYCAEYRNDIHPSEQHKHHKRCNRCRKARVRHTGTAGDFEIFEIG